MKYVATPFFLSTRCKLSDEIADETYTHKGDSLMVKETYRKDGKVSQALFNCQSSPGRTLQLFEEYCENLDEDRMTIDLIDIKGKETRHATYVEYVNTNHTDIAKYRQIVMTRETVMRIPTLKKILMEGYTI